MYSLLYVDDEPGLLEIGKLFLEQTGDFTVTCVLSAKDALSRLQEMHFDAIVADYQMPGMDGIGLLKEVRARHGSLPYILFTGKGREEVVIAAINNGADFYLQKGGDPRSQFAELAHKLRQAIGRVQSELALAASEKRLADIINFLPDATFAIDNKGTVIAWNKAMEELTSVSASTAMGKGNYEYACALYGERRRMLIDLIITPDRNFENDHYTYTIHTPTTLTAEAVLERQKKPPLYVWGTASALFNERGEQIGAIESIRDITDRKKADDELRAANAQLAASAEELQVQYDELAQSEKQMQESEVKYRTLVEHSQDGIFITQDGRIMFCNRGFREILGYAEGELDNAAIEKVIAPEDREMVISRHYARLAGNRLPEVYECLFLAKNGSTRRVRMDVGLATYQGKPATIGTIRDVTEERQREEELKRSEEKYRSLVENLQDVAYRADREGRLVMISPSGVALLGYDSQDDLLGKPLAETFYYDKSRRQEFLERIEKEGTVKNVEIELRHKNGSPITVSTSSHLYYDSAKNVLGVEGVLHDITDLKKKEVELKKTYEQIAAAEEELRGQYGELEQSAAQLRESEARLRYLLEFYKNEQKREYELFMAAVEGAGFITSSPLGYLAFVSKDESEISMFAWSEKAQKACAMPDKPRIYRTIETGLWGEPVRQHRAVITNDYAAPDPAKKGLPEGHPAIARHMGVPLIEDGHTVLIAGVANKQSDYTERDAQELLLLIQGLWQVIKKKRAEAELRQERLFSDAVIDSVPGLLYLYDENLNLVRWNKYYETATGYPREKLAGMNLMEWFAGDEKNAALFRERVQKAITNGFADLETQLTLPDGSRPWYYFTAVPLEIAGKKYFTGIGINVSARKEAEKKIAENRQQLEEIAATIPGVVYQFHARKDGSRYISYYGGRVKEIFGAPESVNDFFAWFTEHVHPDDRQAFTESVDAALLGHSIWQYEGRFVKPTGETVWFQGQASPVRHGDEQVYSGMLVDTTQKKTAELALSESEEKYRLIAENSPDNIVFIDTDGCFRYLNAPAAALFNATPGELAGKHINDLFGGRVQDRIDLLKNVMESRAPVAKEIVADLPTGKRWLDVRLMPVIDNGKTIRGVLGITRDITEQKRMEDAIRETTKKLHLLSGITRHDVSNQLTVMEGYLRLALAKRPDPIVQDFLAKVQGSIRTVQHQLGFMRTYQELGIKAPAWHRIADLVAAAELPGIPVTCTCSDAEIFADPMIGKVFSNLFENAQRHGETVTKIAVGCARSDGSFVITIADDGIGIPLDKKEKIFGKGYGSHTGFGLFLSRDILAITGLAIHETGIEGKGARFEISGPVSACRNFPGT
jgi:PAS domain S-box-containing protein